MVDEAWLAKRLKEIDKKEASKEELAQIDRRIKERESGEFFKTVNFDERGREKKEEQRRTETDRRQAQREAEIERQREIFESSEDAISHSEQEAFQRERAEQERLRKEELKRIEAERQRDIDEIMEKKKLERIAKKLEKPKAENVRADERVLSSRPVDVRPRPAPAPGSARPVSNPPPWKDLKDKVLEKEYEKKLKEFEAEERKAKSDSGLMTRLATQTGKASARMHGETPKSIVSLFWLAVFFHGIIVALLLFGMNDETLILVSLLLYTLLTIFAIFAFRKADAFDSSTIGWLIGISVFCVALPLILSYVPDIPLLGTTTLYDWVLWFRLIIPVWAIYLGMKFDIPIAKWYVFFILGVLLFFFVLNYGLQINTSQLIALGLRPTDISRSTAVFKYIADEGKAMITNFAKKIGSPTNWLNKTESYFGLNYYTSTIDDTEQEPVGFYITGVKSEDKYFYVGSPATVVADIRGKSFTDELFVVPSCYIDKKGDGISTPDSFHILGEEQSAFYCRFDGLEKGSYTAKVSATFDFETWAYLEYNFVDLEIKRSFDARDESINTALNIPSATRSISTPGPVRLGMASADMTQPILIDKTYNTRNPVLGASVLNMWTDGQIAEVYQFALSVPNDFNLVDCTRGTPTAQANENITGYTDYIFTRDTLGDPRLTFEQVRCFLQLKDPASFFAGGAQKVKRTFIGKVKYRYKLEKSVSLIVKP